MTITKIDAVEVFEYTYRRMMKLKEMESHTAATKAMTIVQMIYGEVQIPTITYKGIILSTTKGSHGNN